MKAQTHEVPLSEADEIEAMLPWLVTGKLSREEQARVDRYLAAHPETAAHAALAREEQDAAVAVNEVIRAPSPANLDRLMAQVAATPQARVLSVPSPASVWEKVAGFLTSFSPTTLGIAGAAAAVVLVAQAATIGYLASKDRGAAGGYETASGPVTAQDGVQALVTLQPGITAGALTAALGELKATILDGPRGGGLYRIKINGDSADAQALIAKAKSRSDVFAFVGAATR